MKAFITSSITTVKADAARVAFTALGDKVVWAVIDSGIQGDHPLYGIWSGVRNALNYTTHYQMKKRAGLVGANGVNPILRTLLAARPGMKLHLIGHSFGGRLVTAAVAGSGESALLPVQTLSLLQAAFSHYGLAEKWDGTNNGFFHRVVSAKAVAGPTIITCTANDKAVGLAYLIASLLAGQVAAGIATCGASLVCVCRDARSALFLVSMPL